MQIVIDIPDQMYLNAKADILCGGDILVKAIKNGTPLDKIRAEIMDFEEELFHRPNTDYSDYSAVRYCVEIIDKYKAGGSEE